MAWTPDGNGLTYLHASNEFKNLYRLDLGGGTPREITRFTEGRIAMHRWSPDGKRIVFRRTIERAANLWVTNADGSNPVAVTDFETGGIGDVKWSRDGNRILFTHGEATQNAVLVRNFR
jgi:Tol biopolymer transport system component